MLLQGGRRRTAVSLDDIRRVTRFILHYAELHSLVLPGRVPGFKRDDVKVCTSAKCRGLSTKGNRMESPFAACHHWHQ